MSTSNSGIRKFIYLVIILTIFIILIPFSCKPVHTLDFGYESLSELVKSMGQMLAEGKKDEFTSQMLTKKEFDRAIYPHLPEARQKNPMPADEYWMMALYKKRSGLKNFYFDFKDSKKIKLKKIGRSKKVKIFGPVTIYNQIPVIFADEDGKEIKYERLFSAVTCLKTGFLSRLCRLWVVSNED